MVAGATALIAAIPFVVQMSNAASSTPATTSTSSVTSQPSTATDTDKEVPDAQEAATNASLAKITADVAAQTALQAQPGQVHENKLDNEGGSLAYKIEITNAGKEYDVLVDAVSGKVIKNWEDGQGGPHHGDANEADEHGTEVKDASDANEANEKPGQTDQNEQEDAPTSAATSSAQ